MRSVLTGIVIVLAVALLVWGGLHVFIRPVNPAQKTPEGHFRTACWTCHFVSGNADIVEE